MTLQKRVDEVGDDDDEWEPVEPITSLVPLCVGGDQFSPNTSHVMLKWTVNSKLAMGHQADPVHCYKFHILQQTCTAQYFTLLFRTGEDEE